MDGMVASLGYDRCVLVIDPVSLPGCTTNCPAFLVAKTDAGWGIQAAGSRESVQPAATACASGLGFDPDMWSLNEP